MAASKPPSTPASGEETGQQVRSGHDADLEQRRRVLNEALAERDPSRSPAGSDRQNGAGSGIGAALKMSSEFVAGVLVGAGLGYLLDQFAGTSPWGLIVFLMLGFAAGVLNVLRAAGVVAEPAAGLRAKRPGDDDTT
ncbi:MAG: AtpZ/AtpI family protein [Roseitalea porphyridii]|uniref:AtpZ/AtpI family protein n=1 Tax=Roseitalea porphyridii TaxID=1852022 RepID=UPI0032D95E4E